jgi:hypothetical protein
MEIKDIFIVFTKEQVKEFLKEIPKFYCAPKRTLLGFFKKNWERRTLQILFYTFINVLILSFYYSEHSIFKIFGGMVNFLLVNLIPALLIAINANFISKLFRFKIDFLNIFLYAILVRYFTYPFVEIPIFFSEKMESFDFLFLMNVVSKIIFVLIWFVPVFIFSKGKIVRSVFFLFNYVSFNIYYVIMHVIFSTGILNTPISDSFIFKIGFANEYFAMITNTPDFVAPPVWAKAKIPVTKDSTITMMLDLEGCKELERHCYKSIDEATIQDLIMKSDEKIKAIRRGQKIVDSLILVSKHQSTKRLLKGVRSCYESTLRELEIWDYDHVFFCTESLMNKKGSYFLITEVYNSSENTLSTRSEFTKKIDDFNAKRNFAYSPMEIYARTMIPTYFIDNFLMEAPKNQD